MASLAVAKAAEAGAMAEDKVEAEERAEGGLGPEGGWEGAPARSMKQRLGQSLHNR